MDDKRTLLAIFLCFAVVWVYSELVLAPKYRNARIAEQQAAPAAGAQVAPAAASVPGIQSAVATQGVATSAAQVTASTTGTNYSLQDIVNGPKTTIKGSATTVEISHIGGRLLSYSLKGYKAHLHAEEALNMVQLGDAPVLPLGVYTGTISDQNVQYKRVKESSAGNGDVFELPVGAELSLSYVGTLPDGREITKSFTFGKAPYVFNVQVQISAPSTDGAKVWIEWAQYLSPQMVASKIDPTGYVVLDSNNKLEHVPLTKMAEGMVDHPTPSQTNVKWIGLGDKYFVDTLIPLPNPEGVILPTTLRLGKMGNEFLSRLSGTAVGGSYAVYGGPKDPNILRSSGFELERSVDLGWFAPVAYPLLAIIKFFYSIFGNYGLAIILLTLMIKAIFLPLTKTSLTSMKKMQELQPEMKALRERIKDATELNKAVLELYKKRGVNPMGGCLPMLIQLPVFLGLYNVLLYSIELRHAPYALWIQDLSAPEALHIASINVPVMLLLMAGSMYLQQLTTPQTGDATQQKVMKMMPIVFVVMFVFFIPMPAGLVLYWLVNNCISVTQQVSITKGILGGPYVATAVASLAIFAIGFVVTLI